MSTVSEIREAIELFLEDRRRAHWYADQDGKSDVAHEIAIELGDLEFLLALTDSDRSSL